MVQGFWTINSSVVYQLILMFITSRLIPLAPNTPSKGTWQFFSHASPNQGIDLNAMGEVVVGRDAKVSEETGKNKQWMPVV